MKEKPSRSDQPVATQADIAAQMAAARQQATGQFKDDPTLGAAVKAQAGGDLNKARQLERQDELRRAREYGRQTYPGRRGA